MRSSGLVTVITYRLSAWLGWPTLSAEFLGFFLTMAAVSYWEYRAYRSDVERATGPFPLDRKLLQKNAIIAAGYMILGGAVGLLFHWPAHYAVPGFLVILLVAIVLAPAWLRQKIIWQKAGLPYLFRLANAHHTILEPAANALQKLVRSAAPPHALPRQVILSGPVQSGRTSLAAGIGTEFAFLSKSVRYLSLDRLVEFAMASKPDAAPPVFCDEWGPVNVTSRRPRKKVEMLFAHLKRILKMDRLRLRGPNGAKDEFLLAATAQNLRKLAKLIPIPQPAPA